MVNNNVYHFVGFKVGVEILLKTGNIRKRVSRNRRLRHLVHFVLRFEEKSIHTYVLAKIFQNGANFMQKLTSGFKNNVRNLGNFRQAVKIQKN